ncbi:MAG: hypothetical protein JOZ67_04680 [Gammaproteobacteria bacterium]|nr:hypothetical protein [Gammaproteobacteria bacterium]
MIGIASLWSAILLAAVIVFVVSSIIHMAPLWHRHDYRPLARESEVLAALRPFALAPGDYLLPFCPDMKQMKTPEFQEKLRAGPVAMLRVQPNGPFGMGKPLALWFVYCVLVGVFAAYIASRTLPPGTAYPRVFQIVGATAFMGYALALLQNSIWKHRSWGNTLKGCCDGLIYAALTAGTFGWLWPR